MHTHMLITPTVLRRLRRSLPPLYGTGSYNSRAPTWCMHRTSSDGGGRVPTVLIAASDSDTARAIKSEGDALADDGAVRWRYATTRVSEQRWRTGASAAHRACLLAVPHVTSPTHQPSIVAEAIEETVAHPSFYTKQACAARPPRRSIAVLVQQRHQQ